MTDRAVALITGGAKRVGAAIATELASRGLDLVLTYNTSENEAETLAGKLALEHGVRATPIACDLTDPDAAARACLDIARESG
ncbi:MAG: SDR family NAD(P)-dependent oxidoreductase, partial [Planctomycetota bacterium]